LTTMLMLSKLGKAGARLNRGLELIDSCDAVLDISGGDSFSDIYGLKRFNQINSPKQIAINRQIPLILLPQTYGPYKNPDIYKKACESVQGASQAWARDGNSFQILKKMLGDKFDPQKHKTTVDMAFLLEPEDASDLVGDEINAWISSDRQDSPLIGLNISGLIYNDPEIATRQYGFKEDYRKTVFELVSNFLTETTARILLISHVMDLPGHYESDYDACIDVYDKLNDHHKERVIVAPNNLNESQVKWLISKLDWFCGTRMHSTIAGLSMAVATATISYSDKALGVFESCKEGAQVFDPRILSIEDLIDGLVKSFQDRKKNHHELGVNIKLVKEKAQIIFNISAK